MKLSRPRQNDLIFLHYNYMKVLLMTLPPFVVIPFINNINLTLTILLHQILLNFELFTLKFRSSFGIVVA